LAQPLKKACQNYLYPNGIMINKKQFIYENLLYQNSKSNRSLMDKIILTTIKSLIEYSRILKLLSTEKGENQ